MAGACGSNGDPAPSSSAAGASGSVSSAGAAPTTGGGGAVGVTAGAAGTATSAGGGGAGGAGAGAAGIAGSAAGGAPTSTGGSGGAGLAPWKYFKEVKLDTTPAGANVTTDVAKYPVVIVLRADNFDFAQAKADGTDIRFTTADGTALPYSIESWDAAAKLATLWFKVDVKANATQTVLMSWGNAAATDTSDSHTVFDTKDGFLGVWHLAEPGSTTAGAYKDATATGADLTGLALTADSVTSDGRLGKAVSLSHAKTQWLRLDGTKNATFDVAKNVTYSIWTYAKTYGVQYQTPFSKGDNSWRMHMYGSSDWGENANKHIVEICAETKGGEDDCAIHAKPADGSDVAPNKWWHWVAVINDPTLTLYLNGVLEMTVTSGNWKSDPQYAVGVGANSQIGGRSWDGYLDEARVMGVSKDASWAKLEYESQREAQKFSVLGSTQQRP
jgi:hypothetical protein